MRYEVTNSAMLLASCALETNMIVPFSGQVQVIESRQFLPDFDGCLPSMSWPYVLGVGRLE